MKCQHKTLATRFISGVKHQAIHECGREATHVKRIRVDPSVPAIWTCPYHSSSTDTDLRTKIVTKYDNTLDFDEAVGLVEDYNKADRSLLISVLYYLEQLDGETT